MIAEKDFGFKFKNWDIYKDARKFRKEINGLLKKYPKEERYALVDQTTRALISIVLNIAEGSSKNTDKDMRLYINRAHGSLDEVVACLDCALDEKYINEKEYLIYLENAANLAKRLTGFEKYLFKSTS